MKRVSLSVWSVVLCSGLAAALAISQPANDPKPSQPVQPAQPPSPAPTPTAIPGKPGKPAEPPAELSPEMKAMMEAAAPDEHHKALEKFVSRWDGAMKMWMPGSTEATDVMDTLMVRWDPGMGQRFMIMDHTSKFNNMPFRGTATWGYNKVSKRYESVWRDNMGTGMMMSFGQASPDGKTFTFQGECDDPMGSGGKIKSREIYTWTGDETFKFEMFQTGSDGKEQKVIESTYTKKQFETRPGQSVKPVVRPPAEKSK